MKPTHEDDEPKTWFEWERRKISQPELKGEGSQTWPRLPADNPWAQPMPDEPNIDRTCDGLTTNEE
jgi:hypothetical protein